jgi:hypothetical protein
MVAVEHIALMSVILAFSSVYCAQHCEVAVHCAQM